MEIGLSIGSNLGDRAANLHAIRSALAAADIEITAQSPIYETEPVNVPAEFADKPFLNAVIIVESDSSPAELAARFRAIEQDLGRTRTPDRNMPRPADIDIIYAGQLQLDAPGLVIPHPRWRERRFVVRPLADIRPDLVLPGETRTVAEILLSLPETPKVIRYPGT
jgi:2-amino-4-hydroxy-6-hydroxymethyldihydropteridine diphosphokinase